MQLTVFIGVITLLIGYILAISRERLSTIYNEKIKVINQLHDKILKIERNELSDGKMVKIHICVHVPETKDNSNLSIEQVKYQNKLMQWRNELYDEQRRAQLWIDPLVTDLITKYMFLMMKCKHWEEFGNGSILKDEEFIHYLKFIFQNEKKIINDKTIIDSLHGKPWLLNTHALSQACFRVIQNKIRQEILPWLPHFHFHIYQKLSCWKFFASKENKKYLRKRRGDNE